MQRVVDLIPHLRDEPAHHTNDTMS